MKKGGDGKGGDYAAPWAEVRGRDANGNRILGPEYFPHSPRTGRMVAQSTAERDAAMSFHTIADGGLFDFEEEAAVSIKARPQSARWPHKAEGRYDDARMQAFVEREGTKLTTREWEVYKLFWEGRWSYGQIARRLGVAKERIRECVQRMRAKASHIPSGG